MFGYIFEVTNKKTGTIYLGKRYAVSFDKNYFGEESNEALAVDIEKYGRPSFEVRMIMPYEVKDVLDTVFDELQKKKQPAKKAPKAEAPVVEEPEEVKAPAKRGRKKAVEEE